MPRWRLAVLVLGSAAGLSSAHSASLDSQQIALIRDTAASICNTVKEGKGEKTDIQIQGEVKGQLSGLLGRLVGAGVTGTGTLSRNDFEGLTQDATAVALAGDQGCRQRLFDKMFDKVTAGSEAGGTNVQSGNCSIAAGGNATSNTVNCSDPPTAPASKP